MRPRLSGKHHAHQHLGCITPAARASTSEGQQQTQQHKVCTVISATLQLPHILILDIFYMG